MLPSTRGHTPGLLTRLFPQDASSTLYLCVLLRRQPRVEEAMVTIVNGSRFFWVYVPTLGLEIQITTANIVPAVVTTWDVNERYLPSIEQSGWSNFGLASVFCRLLKWHYGLFVPLLSFTMV